MLPAPRSLEITSTGLGVGFFGNHALQSRLLLAQGLGLLGDALGRPPQLIDGSPDSVLVDVGRVTEVVQRG